MPDSFLPWAGPETWNVPCQRLGQLWAKSQPELPVKWGVHSSPWSEFALVDQGHGMETMRPVAALEETDLLEKPVCPSKTMRPVPWTLLFMAGTLPQPQHHNPGLQESAQWLLLVSFLSKQSWVLHSTLYRTSGQREPLFGVQGLPTRSLARMVEPQLARTNKGRTWGLITWDLPQAAAVGEPPGRGPYSATRLLEGTGLLDTHVSIGLFPAFGWTLHLTPDLVANSHGLLSLCQERAG